MNRLNIIAVALLAACSRSNPAAKGPCRLVAPPQLAAATPPTLAELRTLIHDAELWLQPADDLPAPALIRDLADLRATLDSAPADVSCRALASARASLGAANERTLNGAQRSAVALVLDLAAATLSRKNRP